LIAIKRPAIIPKKLRTEGKKELRKIISARKNDINRFEFSRDVYGADEVKNVLIDMQYKKCCFCESFFMGTDAGDVEHFRPKAAILLNGKLKYPGYYWLAYDWDNLLLSCGNCNRRNKKNKFPLLDERARVKSHEGNIKLERPIFINPCNDNEDPEECITFDGPLAVPVNDNNRGSETILELGLDRDILVEDREKFLNDVCETALIILELVSHGLPLAIKHNERTEAEIYLEKMKEVEKKIRVQAENKSQFSSMVRAFYRRKLFDKDYLPRIKVLTAHSVAAKALYNWMIRDLAKKKINLLASR
jgi:uncharacterized protein (TIGR02646 family)